MSIELIIATFKGDEERAGHALESLKKLNHEGVLKLQDFASIVVHQDNKVEIKDINDVRPKQGAIFGAITGGLLGLIGGPAGVIIGATAGAATGGGAAKLIDYGVSEKMIKEVEEGLQPGDSAVITYIEINNASTIIGKLESSGATVYHETLGADSLDETATGFGSSLGRE